MKSSLLSYLKIIYINDSTGCIKRPLKIIIFLTTSNFTGNGARPIGTSVNCKLIQHYNNTPKLSIIESHDLYGINITARVVINKIKKW